MVEIIMGSLYNESIYHLLCIKRGAIMKKLFLLLTIFSLFSMSAFAVSLDELRNTPERYKLVYSDSDSDHYVEIPSINVVRYNPPYYTINATTYDVAYDRNTILQLDTIFFYDYNRSVDSLINEFNTKEEMLAQLKENNGIKFQVQGAALYNYNGSYKDSYHLYDLSNSKYKPTKANMFSSPYMSAMYSFYKSYNMYFNAPSKDQLF